MLSLKVIYYLNLSLNQLTITSEDVEGQIKLYNMQGSCVLDQHYTIKQNIDISNLSKGNYIVSITNANGFATQKIVLF